MGKNRKRFSRKYYKSAQLPACDLVDLDSELDPEDTIRRINLAKQDLKSSLYFANCVSTLQGVQETHSHLKEIDTIVCFGLGHFPWCVVSRNQLAFISLIREHFLVKEILFQDPAFTPGEIEILRKLDFSVISDNLEGKFETDPDKVYLFYLPHCPKQLTNNLLWRNWSPRLSNILLISNSFSGVLVSQPEKNLRIDAGLILKAEDFTEETPLENNFVFTDVFNDTSIHIFPEELTKAKPESFWETGTEPVYCDPEFITAALEKVKLEDGDSRPDTEVPAP